MSDTSQEESSSASDGAPDAELFEAAVRGDATPDQIVLLQESLHSDPTAIETYLDQIRVHALLEWRSGRVTLAAPRNEALPPSPDTRAIRLRKFGQRPTVWAAAASILVFALVAVQMVRHSKSGGTSPADPSPVLAEVTELHDVVWSDRQSPLVLGTKIGAGELAIQSGTLRMHAGADADVAIAGPARIRWIAANRVAVLSGRITTRVGPNGKGFVVEAPGGEVVDLGTEFGVQVGSAGETAVVVFEGAVELTPKSSSAPSTLPASPAHSTRLTRGQAVRVQSSGDLARIAAVKRQPNSADWSLDNSSAAGDPGTVIATVRDNIRDPAGAKFYQIVHHGLAEDVRAYVDRPHEWNSIDAGGIPRELLGADLLMTFNDDKRAYNLELALTLARPAAVYVLFKPRAQEVPDWLRRDFVDTGLTIGMDEGPPDLPNSALDKGPAKSIDRVFHVWRRDVSAPGTITLGPNLPENNSMYGVAAVALPAKRSQQK